jgi:hypothetical protein
VRVDAAYDLWLGSWETALAAIMTATQARELTIKAAAGHTAVIAAEREVVTREFLRVAGLTEQERSR